MCAPVPPEPTGPEAGRPSPTSPRVSILLPARDAAGTLSDALASIGAQTFRDFECIVVDDGSIDGTAAIVARWVREDSRFHLERTPGVGIVGALLHAAESARAPLLARQDADDTSHPERLALQVELLDREPEVGLVSTQVVHAGTPMTDGGRRYAEWIRSCRTPDGIAHGLWVESPLPHPTVVFRRELYERAGCYRDVGWPEDYDLWLRMLRAGARFAKIDRDLYTWTDSPDRASRTLPEYGTERFLACRAHHLAAFLDGRETIVWGAGRDGRRFSRAFLAEGGRIGRFLDIDPRKIGRTARGRPIVEVEKGLASRTTEVVLVAVGARGARQLIRTALHAEGYREGVDFFCVA